MRKDISPEMYNYNKFPGPQFVVFSDRVKSDAIELLIVENEKNAFDATVFSQRFSEILLKYDYIVGDWGNEQLRLKGFYKDERDVKKANRISRLDDYIKEYCNFGCAYFVLENLAPRESSFVEDSSERRHKRRKTLSQRHTNDDVDNKYMRQKPQRRKSHRYQRQPQREVTTDQAPRQHFVIRQKEQ